MACNCSQPSFFLSCGEGDWDHGICGTGRWDIGSFCFGVNSWISEYNLLEL